MRKLLKLVLLLTALMLCSCSKDDSSTGPSNNKIIPSTGIIDISNNGTMGYTFGLHGTDQVKRYQTFTAEASHLSITSIDVKIRKNDSTATYQNITVELYEIAGNQPANLLAVSSIDASSLGGSFTVINAPLHYFGLTAGKKYAVVLGQSNVQANTNPGFEWCTKLTDTSAYFGKYSGTSWTDESPLGDGWLKIYTSNAAGINTYSFPAGTSVVFYDDFQRNITYLGNGWKDLFFGTEDTTWGKIVYEGTGTRAAMISESITYSNGDTNWTDYTMYTRVKVTTLNTVLSIRFRATPTKVYSVDVYNGTTLLLGAYKGGGWGSMNSPTVSYTANAFYNLKIVVSGSNIKVYFNDSPTAQIDFTDSSPITHGKIGIYANTNSTTPSQAGPGIVDDVLVTVP
jgi:hypothetical protein